MQSGRYNMKIISGTTPTKHQRILTLITLLVSSLIFLIYFSVSAIAKEANRQTNPKLTVVTFNIANYNDHLAWSTRLDLIVSTILDAHADIVALQEVRLDPDEATTRINYENMAEQILRKLNERGEFQNAMLVTQPAMYYPHFAQSEIKTHYYPLPSILSPNKKSYLWEGLSIISKLKIIETGSYFLSQSENCKDTNKRITQYVKIDNHGQSLYIANVHFGLDSFCVADNIQETISYLQNYLSTAPLILLGDFNATPDEPALDYLKKAGLIDVWQKLHGDEKGYTFPSHQPYERIDFIWANKLLATKLYRIEQIKLIGGNPTDGEYPSDHLGLALSL